jgi:hypothetical protein
MTPRPQYGTPAGDTFLALRKLARASGRDTQELLTLFALEGLLARIAQSPYQTDFVLKGGVLLAAFDLRRPTRDVDLLATKLANARDPVRKRLMEILSIDLNDGLLFDVGTIQIDAIRDLNDYPGIRARVTVTLGDSNIKVGIDISFGDPVFPPPVKTLIPRLLDGNQPPVVLSGYPLSMIVAEKIVTAIDWGVANTRWRDFADIFSISQHHRFLAHELHTSLDTVATFRGVSLHPILPALESMPTHSQRHWSVWRHRQPQETDLPEQFNDILASIAAFVDPVISVSSGSEHQWNPVYRRWIAPE